MPIITFDINNGTAGSQPSTITVEAGTEFTIPSYKEYADPFKLEQDYINKKLTLYYYPYHLIGETVDTMNGYSKSIYPTSIKYFNAVWSSSTGYITSGTIIKVEQDLTFYMQYTGEEIIKYDKTFSETFEDDSKGRTFLGWGTKQYSSIDEIQKSYTFSEEYFNEKEIRLYGQWRYTINFTNGGDSSVSNLPSTLYKSHPISDIDDCSLDISTLDPPTKSETSQDGYLVSFYDREENFIKEERVTDTISYTFSSWKDKQNNQYENKIPSNVNENLTLYPIWKEEKTPGYIEELPDYQEVGYIFHYWRDRQNKIIGKASEKYTPDSDISLYPYITEKKLKINYNKNLPPELQISLSPFPLNTTKSYTEKFKLSTTIPSSWPNTKETKDSYTVTYYPYNRDDEDYSEVRTSKKTLMYKFQSWNTNSDGSGTTYNPGDEYNPDDEIYETNTEVTFYAQWASQGYAQNSIQLPILTKTGYTFKGWYTAKSGGVKVGDGGKWYTPSENIILHAQWEKNGQPIATIKRYTGSSTPENVRVWYYKSPTEKIPIAKISYYDGTKWIPIGGQDIVPIS